MKLGFKLILSLMIFSIISCKDNEKPMASKESNKISNSKLERVEPPNWWIGFKDN